MASINDCRREAGTHINRYYQQHKRENVLDLANGYTEQDRETFRAFRDAVRARCDEYETQIAQGQTPEIDFQDIIP